MEKFTLLSEKEIIEEIRKAVKEALLDQQATASQRFLTRNEVIKKLKISLPTLNSYTREGLLKSYKMEGRVWYKESEIDMALTSVEPLK